MKKHSKRNRAREPLLIYSTGFGSYRTIWILHFSCAKVTTKNIVWQDYQRYDRFFVAFYEFGSFEYCTYFQYTVTYWIYVKCKFVQLSSNDRQSLKIMFYCFVRMGFCEHWSLITAGIVFLGEMEKKVYPTLNP